MDRSKWIWMAHPGHFICAEDCRFHLNTYVGGFIVSTVGELLPDVGIREREAERRGITLEGIGDARRADYMRKVGYDDIGCDRKYETMVFKARRAKKGDCCPWRQVSGDNRDFASYNTPQEAEAGHLRLCKKWAKKKSTSTVSAEEKKS